MTRVREVRLERDLWSGEGEFTQALLARLQQEPRITYVRVEDAPSTRAEADYSFISNELFLGFAGDPEPGVGWLRRQWGRGRRSAPALDLASLADLLALEDAIGAADYRDEGMVQYLRTQRIVPPYQTRGYKMVELVRLYHVGHAPRR